MIIQFSDTLMILRRISDIIKHAQFNETDTWICLFNH